MIDSAMEPCHQLEGMTFAFRLCRSNIQTSLLHSYPIFVITLTVQLHFSSLPTPIPISFSPFFYITFSTLVHYFHCCYICLPFSKTESSNYSAFRLILCLSLLSSPYCTFTVVQLLSFVFSSFYSWRIIEDS